RNLRAGPRPWRAHECNWQVRVVWSFDSLMRKKRVGIDHWPKDTTGPMGQVLSADIGIRPQFAIVGPPDPSVCGHGAARRPASHAGARFWRRARGALWTN